MTIETQIENGHARRMGDLENYFAIFQRQKLYKSFTVLGVFNKNVKSDLNKLNSALRAILLKYPALATTIVATDYSDLSVPRPVHDYIRVLDTITLKDLVLDLPGEILEAGSIDEKCNLLNEIELPYGEGHTLWKLAFLDDNTLAYISNHVLADGINGKHFLEDLVEEFNNPTISIESESDPLQAKLIDYSKDAKLIAKLPPPLATVVDHTPPLSFFLKFILKKLTVQRLCYLHDKPTTREDKFLHRVINLKPEELTKIKKALKQNSSNSNDTITFTPFIQIAWLKSIHDNFLSKKTYLKYTDFMIPCNARQYLPEDYKNKEQFKYGWHTSGLQGVYAPVTKITWDVIIRQHEYLRQAFKNKEYLNIPGLLTLTRFTKNKNIDQMMIDKTQGSRRGGTCFSNLGLLNPSVESVETSKDGGDDGAYEIVDSIFTQNLSVTAFCFGINAVSTVKGGTNLVVTMTEGVATAEEFDKIADEFKSILLNTDDIESV